MPVRIQRKRTKGWKMPENTVCVDRPSVWGNPFPITLGRKLAVDLYRELLTGSFNPFWLSHLSDEVFDGIYQARATWLKRFKQTFNTLEIAYICRHELGGKNLATWCKPKDECHGDVLLEIANA